MKVSTRGLEFLKRNEDVRLRMYHDSKGIPTIGVGHVIQEDDDFGIEITEQKAMELLADDIGYAERDVESSVSVPLEQNQFDALCSFTFNVGGRNLRRSTLLKLVNSGDLSGVPAQFLRWVYAGDQNGDGIVNEADAIAGLVARRGREADLFMAGNYGD